MFTATSARYLAGVKDEMAGVPVSSDEAETDRDVATGVYSIQLNAEAERAKMRRA